MGIGWAAYSSLRYSARRAARHATSGTSLGEMLSVTGKHAIISKVSRSVYDQAGTDTWVELAPLDVALVEAMVPPNGYIARQERKLLHQRVAAGEIALFGMIDARTHTLDVDYFEFSDEERAERQAAIAAAAAEKALHKAEKAERKAARKAKRATKHVAAHAFTEVAPAAVAYRESEIVNGHRWTGTEWEIVTEYKPFDIQDGKQLVWNGAEWAWVAMTV